MGMAPLRFGMHWATGAQWPVLSIPSPIRHGLADVPEQTAQWSIPAASSAPLLTRLSLSWLSRFSAGPVAKPIGRPRGLAAGPGPATWQKLTGPEQDPSAAHRSGRLLAEETGHLALLAQ